MKRKPIPGRDEARAQIVYYSVLSVFVLAIAVPFVWMISTSFDRVNSFGLPLPPRMIPRQPTLFYYRLSVHNMNILLYVRNSLIVCAASVFFNLLVAPLTGFCLSKGRFPGKGLLVVFLMTNMMVPFESKLQTVYAIILGLHLDNNFLGVILPGALTNAFALFLFKKFCDDLPYELYEAGVMDGASKFTIFARIFLPLMQPAIATIAVLTVIGNWNDLLWPMIVLSRGTLFTVQIGLALYRQVHPGMATAMAVMSVLPMALVFVFLQRFIVQGIASTGIKQ